MLQPPADLNLALLPLVVGGEMVQVDVPPALHQVDARPHVVVKITLNLVPEAEHNNNNTSFSGRCSAPPHWSIGGTRKWVLLVFTVAQLIQMILKSSFYTILHYYKTPHF